MFNQQMQKLLKGAAEGELSLARDHRFAFPKIDETRNAQSPLNFPHTYQISAYNLVRFNDLRICTLVFLGVESSECGKSSQLNHLRVIKPQSAFKRIVQVTRCSGHSLNYESKLTL